MLEPHGFPTTFLCNIFLGGNSQNTDNHIISLTSSVTLRTPPIVSCAHSGKSSFRAACGGFFFNGTVDGGGVSDRRFGVGACIGFCTGFGGVLEVDADSGPGEGAAEFEADD
jgi:hypothetical protein